MENISNELKKENYSEKIDWNLLPSLVAPDISAVRKFNRYKQTIERSKSKNMQK